jgi:hypothetical protein
MVVLWGGGGKWGRVKRKPPKQGLLEAPGYNEPMEGKQAAVVGELIGAKKAKDPRKHHYVPVFYQSNFVNEKGLLWVYDRARGTYKELHPRVICFERDLYASKPENKPADMQVEQKVLSVVDAAGSVGIRDFLAGNPNRAAEEETAIFMAFQWTRVPTISRDIRATYAQMTRELSRIMFLNVDRARAVMEQYARDTGKELTVAPESMVEAFPGEKFEITATETAFLTNMMEQAVSLTKVLMIVEWEVLHAGGGTGFILCDCPVVVVPPRGSEQVGFLVPGAAKYFPLSRNLCLRLGEPGRKRSHRTVGKEDVRIINQNVAANSERFIMSPSKLQLESIVSRSGCEAMEDTPRFIVETVEADDDGALQKISAQPRRYFYPKNGSQQAP